MNDSIRDWLVLAFAHLGGAQLNELRERFDDVAGILRQDARTLQAAGVSEAGANAIRHPDDDAIAAALSWAEADGNHLVPADSDDYPELLLQVRDCPPLLYVKGAVSALHMPALALVGSRNPTRGGVHNAARFAEHLGRSGFTIVSGLAQGIDSAAHRGALAGGALTAAVLGHGIDRVYPAVNRDLAHRIVERGALVSEYPLGTPPRRENFPQRNRIISGLSLGTLVIEAASRSGSLITARTSAEQGREVFAIPGSIHNLLARGCHRLIRDGAKLVESATDIIDELAPLVGHLMQHKQNDAQVEAPLEQHDDDYKRLLQTLGHDPASADELVKACGLTIGQVSSMLLMLELEGEIEVVQGGRYSRLSK